MWFHPRWEFLGGMQDPKDKLELKENVDSGVYVKDLTTFVVKSAMEIDHVMQVRAVYRST